MSSVIADISMSIDGYVTGPDAGPAHGLGIGGEGIHAWVLDGRRAPHPLLTVAGGRRHSALRLAGRMALVQREVIHSPRATHVTYDVVNLCGSRVAACD